ncbi:unnamed protein product [Symbiodinium sp. CCMP2592]|nr:unnamed protein product [Symbiodinium sp. CCMP2592]
MLCTRLQSTNSLVLSPVPGVSIPSSVALMLMKLRIGSSMTVVSLLRDSAPQISTFFSMKHCSWDANLVLLSGLIVLRLLISLETLNARADRLISFFAGRLDSVILRLMLKEGTASCYRDDDEIKQVIVEARSSNQPADWKKVHRMRAKAQKDWKRLRLQRVLAGDWGDFRQLQADKKRRRGWWGDMLEHKSAAALSGEVQSHLRNKMIDPDRDGWDEELSTLIQKITTGESFVPFEIIDVRTELQGMRCKSAVGPDYIGVHLLRVIASHDQLSSQLLDLINHIVSTQQIPGIWEKSFLALLAKVDVPTKPGDLRPIAVSSAFNKLVNRLVCSRALPLMRRGSRISACGRGRQAADLIGATSRVRDVIKEWKLPAVMCKLDVSGAFDRIDRRRVASLLTQRLGDQDVGCELKYLLSQLRCHTLEGRVPGGDIISIRPNTGIKQGAPESAEVFGLVVDALLSEVTESPRWSALGESQPGLDIETMFYQDDIFVLDHDLCTLGRRVRIIDRCLQRAGLKLATNKTKIIASPAYKGSRHIKIGEDEFAVAATTESIKVLGVDFSFFASPSQQAQELLSRTRAAAASHKDILTAKGPWSKKIYMMKVFVESQFSWTGGAVHWSQEVCNIACTVIGPDIENISLMERPLTLCLFVLSSGDRLPGGVSNKIFQQVLASDILVDFMHHVLNVSLVIAWEMTGTSLPLIVTIGLLHVNTTFCLGIFVGVLGDSLLFVTWKPSTPSPSLFESIMAVLWWLLRAAAVALCLAGPPPESRSAQDDGWEDHWQQQTGENSWPSWSTSDFGGCSSSASSSCAPPSSSSNNLAITHAQHVAYMSVAWDENISLGVQLEENEGDQQEGGPGGDLVESSPACPAPHELPVPFAQSNVLVSQDDWLAKVMDTRVLRRHGDEGRRALGCVPAGTGATSSSSSLCTGVFFFIGVILLDLFTFAEDADGVVTRWGIKRPGRDRWHNLDGSLIHRTRLEDPAPFTVTGLATVDNEPVLRAVTFYGKEFLVKCNSNDEAGESTTAGEESEDPAAGTLALALKLNNVHTKEAPDPVALFVDATSSLSSSAPLLDTSRDADCESTDNVNNLVVGMGRHFLLDGSFCDATYHYLGRTRWDLVGMGRQCIVDSLMASPYFVFFMEFLFILVVDFVASSVGCERVAMARGVLVLYLNDDLIDDEVNMMQLTNSERALLQESGVPAGAIARMETMLETMDRQQQEGRGAEGRWALGCFLDRATDGLEAMERAMGILQRRLLPRGYLPLRRVPRQEMMRWNLFQWARNQRVILEETLGRHLDVGLMPADNAVGPGEGLPGPEEPSPESIVPTEVGHSTPREEMSITPTTSAREGFGRVVRSSSEEQTSDFALNSAGELFSMHSEAGSSEAPRGPPPPRPVNYEGSVESALAGNLHGIWLEPGDGRDVETAANRTGMDDGANGTGCCANRLCLDNLDYEFDLHYAIHVDYHLAACFVVDVKSCDEPALYLLC